MLDGWRKRSTNANHETAGESLMGVLLDDVTLERITKQMMDEGRVLEAGWTGFRVLCLPADIQRKQEDTLRRIYFIGAKCLMTALEASLQSDDSLRPQRMAQLRAELDRWDALGRERKPGRPH
jgi:hypothetical protein